MANHVPWLLVIIAGLFEVAWAYSMKESQGFTRPVATVLTFALMLVSFLLLAQAMKTLPLGTAYAVWTGVGAVGAAAVGILVLDEPRSTLRLASLSLVVLGIFGLKLTS